MKRVIVFFIFFGFFFSCWGGHFKHHKEIIREKEGVFLKAKNYNPTPIEKKMTKEQVKEFQYLLKKEVAPSLKIDGKWGLKTQKAWEKFIPKIKVIQTNLKQKIDSKLTVDGKWGPKSMVAWKKNQMTNYQESNTLFEKIRAQKNTLSSREWEFIIYLAIFTIITLVIYLCTGYVVSLLDIFLIGAAWLIKTSNFLKKDGDGWPEPEGDNGNDR